MTELNHVVMRARAVGEDWASVDCLCGWHFDGTVKEANEAAEKHVQEKRPGMRPGLESDSD